ncbi:hypothetical protein ACHMW6_00220 (plasmid) [Pseudoduganella sp. UC29_106]|uniref:hypothetical protein n=1 Tax=Pseudoduganella sp. UC29_106 TaxID=3374553 RepID=UPI00375653EC
MNSDDFKDELKEGKLYKFDGVNLVELEKDDSVIKLPITKEADQAVKKVRNDVAKVLNIRSELSIVASALLIEGAKSDKVVEIVRSYGAKIYQS